MEKARRKSLVSKIKQSIEQNRECGVLYLDTVTPDGFGSPKMKITVKYTGENAESELYFRSVKPEAVTFDLGGVGGKVINEQNIAKCDTTFAELGESSGIKHLDDVSLAKIPNRVKLCFDKIV